MKSQHFRYTQVLCLVMAVLVPGCNHNRVQPITSDLYSICSDSTTRPVPAEEIAQGLLNSSEIISTCNDCHADLLPDRRRKDLTALHGKLFTLLTQESENSWCINCHFMNENDSLKLALGKSLTFSESNQVCSQCHPKKLREWEVGVHGKRMGDWGDEKKYMLRVNTDYPHRPKIKAMAPEPPPRRQDEIR